MCAVPEERADKEAQIPPADGARCSAEKIQPDNGKARADPHVYTCFPSEKHIDNRNEDGV